MRYVLDTEFNGFSGQLISMALVREDGVSLSMFCECPKPVEWVAENVMPHVGKDPFAKRVSRESFGWEIAQFLWFDQMPHVIADWPDDIRYLMECLITGPGTMVNIRHLSTEIYRVDSWPNDIEGAIQHNCWWDAMALRYRITGKKDLPKNVTTRLQ